METRSAGIAVVGAGPAGTCAALKLAELGHEVLLIEQAGFPRAHLGEALSPGVETHLDSLGLAGLTGRLEGLRFDSSALRWQSADISSRPVHPGAITVDRGRFDQALLEAAIARGVSVLQPARVRRATRAVGAWRLEIEQDGRQSLVQARFLFDATGRTGLLPRRRTPRGPTTFALYADWRDGGTDHPQVSAGADHWIWTSPVPGRGHSVIVFTDRPALRRRTTDLADHYAALVRQAALLAPGALLGPVGLCDATSYGDAEVAGPDFIKIGEAAFALDPLSSSGVQKAMASAITAAIVANTVLRRPSDAALALAFYAGEQLATVRRHLAWTAGVYAEQGPHAALDFWQARAAGALTPPAQPARYGGGPLVLSSQATIQSVASVSNSFVEPRQGLVHPALERPIVYVAGASLADILAGTAPEAVPDRLRERLPPAAAAAIIARLFERGVLVGPGHRSGEMLASQRPGQETGSR